MSEDFESYYKEIDDYLSRDFFINNDRKIAFLLGRYYNYLANKEKNILKTQSLYTKLPAYTKRFDKKSIYQLLDKCNSVVKRLISKNKTTSQTAGGIRDKLNELLAYDLWQSNFDELSIAFMMGFTFFVESIKNKDTE
ncbi:MAG: hypothetical protein JXA54_10850 [Candidatus Heimdallarchaeota archaeon]|nr:hypothetical protein [Candidatus Heimdallarchaeota archaeon]